MQGKKTEPRLKLKIIKESYQVGCVITQLARRYGISKDTIYGWRSKYSESVAARPGCKVEDEPQAIASASDARFIEVSVNESEQCLNLQEATLKFDNFSLMIQGQIRSSVLLAVVKTLEKSC